MNYTKQVAERKVRETNIVKDLNKISKVPFPQVIRNLDKNIMHRILSKQGVIQYILNNSKKKEIAELLAENSNT